MNCMRALAISTICAGHGFAAQTQELTVATWNLEHFAGQNHSGCRERTQADYDEIRRTINAVDADVWLFQEVESSGALARVMDTTRWTFHAETRPERHNPSVCRDNGREMTMQRTIVAARKGLVIGRVEELHFMDVAGDASLRYGIAVNLAIRGQAVQVVNVHLKSGCFTGTDSSACLTLFEQIPYLASYISMKTAEDMPLIIGGDFNRRLSSPDDEVFRTLTYNHKNAIKISSVEGTSKCSLRGEPGIDYILTNGAFREKFSTADTYEYTFTGPFNTWPSDHCPNVVRFTMN